MRLHTSFLIGSVFAAAIALSTSVVADRIHTAAEGLNYTEISKILQEEPSLVNLKNAEGRTPLLCALNTIYASNFDDFKKTIDVLLVSHADIGARDKDGNTIVHYAARQGIDVVKQMVGLGRNLVVATNKFQETPLHTAVRLRKNDVAEFLITSGAYVDARDKDGVTPLHIAVMTVNTDMVRMLLKYHADINARTRDGKTPYTLSQNDSDSTLQRFIRKNGGHE